LGLGKASTGLVGATLAYFFRIKLRKSSLSTGAVGCRSSNGIGSSAILYYKHIYIKHFLK
jgi:hypothetical protein